MPLDITSQLANLFKGFYHRLAQNCEVFEGAAVHHGDGKVQMSVDLYKRICGWLLKCGTTDGLFTHCFLTLTWNLACQSQNTSLVKLRDIIWSTCFDAFQVFFEHSKTDQLGEKSKYLHHLYANPLDLSICPVMSLSLYFTSCFNCPVMLDSYLFPGRDQEEHFSKILKQILVQHEVAVVELGNDI